MGLDLTSLYFLISSKEDDFGQGPFLSLGYPDLNFTTKALNEFREKFFKERFDKFPQELELNSENLFKHFGYESFSVLDVYEHEKVDIVWNLNNYENLPKNYINHFSLVIDPGTLQHIFDIRSCLNCIKKLVKQDGYVYHVSPGNNYLDHGFYQISPTLFQDYYTENGFTPISLSLQPDVRIKELIPYKENVYRNKNLQGLWRNGNRVKVHQVCQKKEDMDNITPQQHYYSLKNSEQNISRNYIKEISFRENGFKKQIKKLYISFIKR